jgi:Trk K+ transport system NAD-binding subunit
MRTPFIVIILTYTIAIIGLVSIEGINDQGEPYHMSIFDALYFISYTATTIGFGETPFEFTYAQRLWVTLSIYLTVIGWLYGIGTLISLLQNKLFLKEIAQVKFKKQVQAIQSDYIIVLGFNYVTNAIIKELLKQDIRVVVVEKDEEKVNALTLENYTPSVPVLLYDAYYSTALELCGIQRPHCKAIISLFKDDALNLRVAIVSKLLNKNIQLAIKATTKNSVNNLKDVGVDVIVNPFYTIANELKMVIKTPNILRLEKWIYQIDKLDTHTKNLPQGKYIVCGFGRLGYNIYRIFKHHNIEFSFIELNSNKKSDVFHEDIHHFIFENADNKETLIKAGVKEASAIIAFTNNDTVNLSILATAKQLNENIITIAREDEMEDVSIFSNANIDHLFLPSKILINKISNALIFPLAETFVKHLYRKDEAYAALLIKQLLQQIDNDPLLYELEINKTDAAQIYTHLDANNELCLKIFKHSLHNRNLNNNLVVLLVQTANETILLPNEEMKINIGDKILFACDEHAIEDIEYICLNEYEFYYALTGNEKKKFIF